MFPGQRVILSPQFTPSTVDNKDIFIQSGNESYIAVANHSHEIQAVGLGTTNITVESGIGKYRVEQQINVVPFAQNITISPEQCTLDQDQTAKLTATILPANAYSKELIWSSSNPNVATVDQQGVVTGKYSGSTIITAKSKLGNAVGRCKVVVCSPVEGIELNINCLSLTQKSEYQLLPTFTPAHVEATEVVYSSSNPSVVTVNNAGLVKAVGKGSASVTATTNPGRHQAQCTFTVVDAAQKLKLNAKSKSLYMGASYTLTPTALPKSDAYTSFRFISSRPEVASVDQQGLVCARAAGKATIRVLLPSGKSASCRLTVRERKVSSIKLNKRSAKLTCGFQMQLSATLKPANATFPTIRWKSSNPAVASVDATGRVRALKPGKATISALSADGKKRARCKFTVYANEFKRSRPASGRKRALYTSAKRISFEGDWLCVELFLLNRTRRTVVRVESPELYLLDTAKKEVYECGIMPDIDLSQRPLRNGKFTVVKYRLPRSDFAGANLRAFDAALASGDVYVKHPNALPVSPADDLLESWPDGARHPATAFPANS